MVVISCCAFKSEQNFQLPNSFLNLEQVKYRYGFHEASVL